MAKQLQKLELSWIGKGNESRLEPRILIEDPNKSFGDPSSESMLINGDNLLALKALEQNFTGQIKCIAIDPPYNTGSAFEHYDDGVEHSQWLNLMKPRLEILKTLLSDDGSIWINIDDNEVHYLKILCDEVFGRNNYISTICVKMSTASGVKTSHREKTMIKEKEFILCYAKNSSSIKLNPQYVPKIIWDDEFQYFLEKNSSDNSDNWEVKRLKDVLKVNNIEFAPTNEAFQNFISKNANSIWRRAFIRNEFKELSQNEPNKIFVDDKGLNYYYRGRQMYFYSDRIHTCFTEQGYLELPSFLLGDFWSDINTGKLFNEGGIEFRNGKKPEFLLARIIDLTTQKGDFVLDSFLGSGTTGAVAHKMQRKWIGIELGEHATTHCLPRIKSVVQGTDSGGITEAVNWKGGGGFKFYTLAPSLVLKDKYGTEIINPEYNPNMLAAAMAKQEGFRYQPDENNYWKQGMSSEKDFIFTTTQFVTIAILDKLAEELNLSESLLVCCKSFDKGCNSRHVNITIKKIPQMLLGRCEYGRDDYSFNIVNLPHEDIDVEYEPEEIKDDTPAKTEKKTKTKKQTDDENQSTLF